MKRIINYLFFVISISCTYSQTGVIKSYFQNKNLKSEISYINDVLDGKSIYYYENGNKKLEQNFSRGVLNGWYRTYFENGNLMNEFYLENGIKDGDEKNYNENGELISIKSYNKGILIQEQKFELTEKIIAKSIESEKKPKIIEAYPIGGIEEIQSKIIYPTDALKYGLEGNVILLLELDESGKVVKTSILKSLGLGCDEEAIRVVKLSSFMPARVDDKFFKSELTLEINFKLPKKYEEKEIHFEDKYPQQENIIVTCLADECPKPIDNLTQIYSRIIIPNVAKALKIKGVVIIECNVNLNGELTSTKILQGVGYGCDQEIEKSLKQTRFSVAKKNGKLIESTFTINFPFRYDFK